MLMTTLFFPSNYLFITLTGILERGIQIDGLGCKSFMTYESNVLFALRFMIDCNIVGGNWIEVTAGKYKKTAKTISYSQLEFDCLYPYMLGCFIFKMEYRLHLLLSKFSAFQPTILKILFLGTLN